MSSGQVHLYTREEQRLMHEARAFAQRLVAWQRAHGRHDLPWQRTRDPYRIWLSEIMLQQTQVEIGRASCRERVCSTV